MDASLGLLFLLLAQAGYTCLMITTIRRLRLLIRTQTMEITQLQQRIRELSREHRNLTERPGSAPGLIEALTGVTPAQFAGSAAGWRPPPPQGSNGRPSPMLVDINSATAAALIAVNGIGPVIADRIIAGRPYGSLDDLPRVNGISLQSLRFLRRYLRCDVPTTTPAPAAGRLHRGIRIRRRE